MNWAGAELEPDRQNVDSHGQSVVAFAFTKMIGFQLMPRLKAIHSRAEASSSVTAARTRS